jgi:hypothetical protein
MSEVDAIQEVGTPEGRMSFLDPHLRDALASRAKPHAHVAIKALHLLSGPEMFAISMLPLDDGRHQEGSRNLLSLALYALFLVDLKRDAFLTAIEEEQTSVEVAGEMLVYTVRKHLADARTLQDLQRVMGYEAVGRTDLNPGDRAAWSLAWRALYHLGQIPEPDERAGDNFTHLLSTAENWLRDGHPWTEEKELSLRDLASQHFIGIASPSEAAVATNRTQEEWAKRHFPSLFRSFGDNLVDLLAEFSGGDETHTSGDVGIEFLPTGDAQA